ncbi:MAG: hypothetical protein RQ868_06165 [Meiothermus sp.]|uniref:hypothetical protein n=1 Tax=Meiothermus sp. TaxID=1955249 RepID=UPI0028CC0435|nr:hypothetical protein [Meiothermus sp.]MDT7920161.1 hypothetical protein [Meiothermus sp.]
MNVTTRRGALEDSPESFWERFSSYAQSWPVSPEPMGSPMLEVLTPWGPLFVFDRALTPFSGEETPLIFHGQVERWEEATEAPTIEPLGGGRYLVRGRVGDVLDAQYFVLQVESPNDEKNLQMILAAPSPPGPGTPVRAYLAPPLMAFRPDAYSR